MNENDHRCWDGRAPCDAFVGIDVAFAKRKRLPVAVCVRRPDATLEILRLGNGFEKPPGGLGNVAALDPRVREQFAQDVAQWLRRLAQSRRLIIQRVAIDAPSDYCRDPTGRRAAERCLDGRGISCFTTPCEARFREKVSQAQQFLQNGGAQSRLPNANQIWMLVGFQLFRTLGERYECLETYPQAVVRQLNCAGQHKTSAVGLESQIEATAAHLGTTSISLKADLAVMGYGSRHDRLDALLSAWVASLEETDREALGTPPNDAIWIPRSLRPRLPVKAV